MDEIPKRVGPSRPWEGSEVLEVPSLTDQMDVAMDVEGVVREGVLSHIGLLTTSDRTSHAPTLHTTELRGIGPSGTRMRQRRSQPLTEAHPELIVIETPGLCREYRVENRQLSRSQQHGRLAGLPWISWAFSVILVGWLWPSVRSFQYLPTSSIGVTHNTAR